MGTAGEDMRNLDVSVCDRASVFACARPHAHKGRVRLCTTTPYAYEAYSYAYEAYLYAYEAYSYAYEAYSYAYEAYLYAHEAYSYAHEAYSYAYFARIL